MNNLLTVAAASNILKIKERTVLSYIRKGRLKALKLDKEWRIEEEVLQHYIDAKKNYE